MKRTIATLAAAGALVAPQAAGAVGAKFTQHHRPHGWTMAQARAEVVGYERNLDGNVLDVTITGGHWLKRGHKAAFTVVTAPTTIIVGQTNPQQYQWTDIAEPNPGGGWFNVWSVGFTQPGPINISG